MDKDIIPLIIIIIVLLILFTLLFPSIYASDKRTPSIENIKLFYTTDTMKIYKVLLGVILNVLVAVGVTAAISLNNKY